MVCITDQCGSIFKRYGSLAAIGQAAKVNFSNLLFAAYWAGTAFGNSNLSVAACCLDVYLKGAAGAIYASKI